MVESLQGYLGILTYDTQQDDITFDQPIYIPTYKRYQHRRWHRLQRLRRFGKMVVQGEGLLGMTM